MKSRATPRGAHEVALRRDHGSQPWDPYGRAHRVPALRSRARSTCPRTTGGAIALEVERLGRSLDASDVGQALSDLKCLVEAAARITMDIDGAPADPSASFDSIVNRAHQLLAGQPGYDLTNEPQAGRIASQASKIARNLGDI
jgi:hypothetical protein